MSCKPLVQPCSVPPSNCFPCDPPTTNLSAEKPDVLLFYGQSWTSQDPILNPVTGQTFQSVGCLSTCTSTLSQSDADLCAQRQQINCNIGTWGGGPTPGGGPPTVFLNNPQSCQSICPDGLPFIFTVPAGVFAALSQALADQMAFTYACRQARLKRFCLSNLNVPVCVGQTYNQTVSASGPVVTPCTWQVISGALPPGLTLGGFSPNIDITLVPSITIQGTATQVGNFNFTLQCLGSDGSFMQKQYAICVTAIGPSLLPNATLNNAYSQLLSDMAGCLTGQTWTLISGALPAGLSLNATTGLISGTPTQSGTFNITVQETSGLVSCSAMYSLTVGGATCPNQVIVQNVSGIFTNPCPGQLNSVPGFFLWNGILVLGNPNCNSAGCGVNGVIYLTTGMPQRFPGSSNSEISDAVLLRPKSDLSAWTCMIGIGAGHGTQISISGTGWGLVIGGMALDGATGIRVWSGSNGSTSPGGVYTSDSLGCIVAPQITLM